MVWHWTLCNLDAIRHNRQDVTCNRPDNLYFIRVNCDREMGIYCIDIEFIHGVFTNILVKTPWNGCTETAGLSCYWGLIAFL